MLICNVFLFGVTAYLGHISRPDSLRTLIIAWSFFPVSLLAILVKDRRIVMACLVWLILLYPHSTFWH